MTDLLVRRWLEAGKLDLQLPGAGATLRRWRTLACMSETDLVAGRLAEAHTDAVAILAELAGPPPRPGQLWAVWAAEAPDHRLTAQECAGVLTLDGVKPWCSG